MKITLERLDDDRIRFVVTEHMNAVERLTRAGPNPLRTLLEELRTKGSLTDAHNKLDPSAVAEILERHAAGPGAPEDGAFWVNLATTHELADDQIRIRAILQVVGMMGDEEALKAGSDVFERGIREHQDVHAKGWKYTAREYSLLCAAQVVHDTRGAPDASEIAAVIRMRDEITALDPELARLRKRSEQRAAQWREHPAEANTAAMPRPRDREAREWLHRKRQASLASNRFPSTAEAEAFVEELYSAGASKVMIAGDHIMEEPEGPYADAVRVKLPEDASARAAVFAVVNREAVRGGFEAESDTGQKQLFLWWD